MVGMKQKCLSPIKEESCEPGAEPCTVSPFGIRRKVPANPEERPICPGLKETEKTFEDFVEEQLKLDKQFLKKDKQLRTAEKRNFLRKGAGRSRICKSKDTIQNTTSTQLHRPSTVKCSSQENLLRHNVPPHDGKSLALDHDKHSNQKNEECSQQPNQIRSTKLQDECSMFSGRKVAPKIHLLEERVGFKKVNDHIVRVDETSTEALCLTNEIKQLLLHSVSDDSTSAEDDTSPPTPPNPSRINSDHNLELSDEDYASDSPSDAGPSECPRTSQCFLAQLSSSSGSDDGSDSELQQLCWSEPHKPTPKETSGEAISLCARSYDLLDRMFPHVKSTGKTKTDNQLWEKVLKTQDSMNGSEPVTYVQENIGLDIRVGTSNDSMMDKMKTEQDNALNFIRSEMDHFSNNDQDSLQNFRSSDHTPQDVTHHHNETEDLRKQIQFLKEQLKRREHEWWQAHSELQSRVDALTRENKALMSQHVGQVRAQSSGRSTPHPDAQNLDVPNSQMKHNSTQVAVKAERNVREETRYPDGKVEQLLSDGSRVIVFRNGTRKEIGVDQKSIMVTFFNGDVKRILADGTTVYYYSDAQTTHSTYPSGLEVLEFPNKQREKRHPNGTREIFFSDGTVKTMYPDGRQESFFPDGTIVKLSKNGEKTVEFTNGQREIHTSQYKQRIYPDGTVKTVYLNGRQETKYSSGRIHVKNNEDNFMMERK
ncbi:centromere protein J isoform X2 [Neoarius graeffei]|uniref:centromere protein J isoform X2 n=1 Tax=Neoarius graeffei TaxID=443677 RepID=UPI00298CEA22|nr:centromere protein J isoform X2 [Neoarius graeffei]